MGYAVDVIWGFRRYLGTALSDRLGYAVFLLAAYAALAIAAALGLYDTAEGLNLFAAFVTALLVAGIRIGWDMLVFLVTSSRDAT